MRRGSGGVAMLFGAGRSLVTMGEGWRRWFLSEMMQHDDGGATVLFGGG